MATLWNFTHPPHNKVEGVRPEFNKDNDSGPIKKGTHPLILQSTTLPNEQKSGLAMWGQNLLLKLNKCSSNFLAQRDLVSQKFIHWPFDMT